MSAMLYIAICIGIVLTCAVAEDRERTVRRSFSIETEEQEFIESYDSFLDDVDGNNTYTYWPDGVDPFEEFGLMQKTMVSDILLQLCIISGVYVRPPKPTHTPDASVNDTTIPYEKKNTHKSGLLQELLDLMRNKRAANPPAEDWEHDPYDVLEDAEYQFTNLCYSLFELRRINRKLKNQKQDPNVRKAAP